MKMKELAKLFEKLGFEVNEVKNDCVIMEKVEYAEKNLKRIVCMLAYLLKKAELQGSFEIKINDGYITLVYKINENDLKILGGLINE